MELNDKIIFKVALITSLVGIIGMLVFASYIEPKEIQIKDITRNNIGETVAVTGVVESIKESSSGSSCFIELNDGTGKINLIIFESTLVELQDAGNDLESFENQKVKVIGSITEYKSSMELILSNANSIKLVS
ncbi:MAG: exodeoxyribonuclease VII large subunit [Methanobrevibacter sp.]|uniref:exodeoxyribonuclease VII large subunit n=1 Tax=Methanobrevibacter sp. TaxID=66852 RepID=UPI0025D80F9E|nr:exodeoxyribonuclease VII large subunit [Methanobrevibacter sp.]MBQ6138173.1 exodeoxyribonuclease VII large subunit [Methanobrevibacter sp.]